HQTWRLLVPLPSWRSAIGSATLCSITTARGRTRRRWRAAPSGRVSRVSASASVPSV
ncbi:unnamed protein product, partial [Prorocentrum cordatum]